MTAAFRMSACGGDRGRGAAMHPTHSKASWRGPGVAPRRMTPTREEAGARLCGGILMRTRKWVLLAGKVSKAEPSLLKEGNSTRWLSSMARFYLRLAESLAGPRRSPNCDRLYEPASLLRSNTQYLSSRHATLLSVTAITHD